MNGRTIATGLCAVALAGCVGACSSQPAATSATSTAPAGAPSIAKHVTSAGGYWIATGSDPGFGPYLDLLQWGPPSNGGVMRGTLASYSMSVKGDGSGPDGGAGQVISTTNTVTITGSTNLAISSEIGGDPVTDTATISGNTLTMYDPEHQLLAPSPTVFKPGTPSEFSADLARIVQEAPNGMANY